jgi:hypothetical protein
MSRSDSLDDAAIEALLTGNGAGGELNSLAAFVGELRSQATGPLPAPSPQLASMLELGFAPDGGGAPAAADHAGGRGLRPAGPRRRGLGATARAVVAGVVAVMGLTAVGAAGALPGAAQDAVATAVEAVTPFEFPDEADDRADTGKRVSTGATEGGLEVPQAGEAGGGGGRPEAPGQAGLDRAGETPAAGHVPPSVPAGGPGTAGAPAGTPAAGPPATGTPAVGATLPPSTDTVPATPPPALPTIVVPDTEPVIDGLTGGRGPSLSTPTVPSTIPVGGLRP